MAGSGIRLVAFDMDGVLTAHPSSWEYVHSRMGVDNRKNLDLYRKGAISYIDFLKSDVQLWIDAHPGIGEKDIRHILGEIPLTEGIGLAVDELRSSGIATAIISGGIYWLAERICTVAQFDRIFANRISTDIYGKIIPDGSVMVEPRHKDKVLAALQQDTGIGIAETASVGDTLQDSAMFQRSSISIAFNTRDPKVVRSATHHVPSGNLLEAVRIIRQGL